MPKITKYPCGVTTFRKRRVVGGESGFKPRGRFMTLDRKFINEIVVGAGISLSQQNANTLKTLVSQSNRILHLHRWLDYIIDKLNFIIKVLVFTLIANLVLLFSILYALIIILRDSPVGQ